MSFSYSNKNDFDDMNVYHQTKSTFKNEKQGLVKMQNSRRSTFIDCFTGDSIITPATICPEGVNSTKNYPCIAESKADRFKEANARLEDAERLVTSLENELKRTLQIQKTLYNDITRPRKSHDKDPAGAAILNKKLKRISITIADLERSLAFEKAARDTARLVVANNKKNEIKSGFGNRAGILNPNKRKIIQNRKLSFFNSIVE
jgi:hypothetical protein